MLAVKHFVNIIKNMKRLAGVIFVVLLLAQSATLYALSPLNVVISEIQTESASSASEEFITIHNNSAEVVDITGWRLQYFSATSKSFTSPTRTITLMGTMSAGSDLAVSSTGYTAKNSTIFFSPTLAAAGGHVRLISGKAPNEIVHDLVGWGTALLPEQEAATGVDKGSIYKRAAMNGTRIDTDNNKADFAVVAETNVPPVQQPTIGTGTTESPNQSTAQTYEGLIINELLPNPAAPKTDANDEFIELYNDSDQAIDMIGLTLQTGTSNSYSYKLTGSIGPRMYMVLYATQTKLTLSNSAGKARVIDTQGAILNETAAYGSAPSGSSWQLHNDTWSWSLSQTPGAVNSVPKTDVATSPNVKAATTTKAVVGSSTTKASTSKAAKATKQNAATQTNKTQVSAAAQPGGLNKYVLVGVGILALSYVVYEYRYDIAQKLRQFKSNRTISQNNRK